MKIQFRLAAAITAIGLAAISSALVAPAAQAAPAVQAAPKSCKITGFRPTTVKVGASPKKVKFKVKTKNCNVTWWSVSTDVFAATKDKPTVTIDPSQLSGAEDVLVSVEASTTDIQKGYVNGLRFKARTTFNTRTKAGPEPITKGKKITVKGQLVRADWKNGDYDGYSGVTVRVQFRTKNGHYRTVKKIKSGQYGVAMTKVTARTSGVWRMKFSGSSGASASNARGDYVKVKN